MYGGFSGTSLDPLRRVVGAAIDGGFWSPFTRLVSFFILEVVVLRYTSDGLRLTKNLLLSSFISNTCHVTSI